MCNQYNRDRNGNAQNNDREVHGRANAVSSDKGAYEALPTFD